MFGSISGWFHRWLGGIQVAEDAVGADRIVIRPQVVDGLTHVKCSHQTIRGRVVSNWTKGEGKTEFEITIPPDTEALVWLPGAKGSSIQGADGIRSIDFDPAVSCHRFHLVSGAYRFTVAD
jgi:alpha-L-rhamnosidase